VLLLLCSPAFPQSAKQPPHPETARQAILEVITDSSALQRHLPEATKSYWTSHSKDIPTILIEGLGLGMMAGGSGGNSEAIFVANRKPDSNYESFNAGPILMKAHDPKSGTTAELVVDSDDLSGDEDTMELSFHIDGPAGAPVMPFQLPSMRLHMKLEGAVWRFEEVDLTEKVELGSPAFVKQIERQNAQMTELWATDAVREVVTSEADFLKKSSGKQYTCSLKELAPENASSEAARMLNAELRFAQSKDYEVRLGDCDATGFHVLAIPKQQGQAVYCSDQSGAIKSSTAAADCFSSGQPVRLDMDMETSAPK